MPRAATATAFRACAAACAPAAVSRGWGPRQVRDTWLCAARPRLTRVSVTAAVELPVWEGSGAVPAEDTGLHLELWGKGRGRLIQALGVMAELGARGLCPLGRPRAARPHGVPRPPEEAERQGPVVRVSASGSVTAACQPAGGGCPAACVVLKPEPPGRRPELARVSNSRETANPV